ncbi:MAG TPA: phosphoribosylamine--glycine ligase, partial [Richelia sp.]|nr:phosphoribosylamine--glycine ligase [Richelia sp.]
CVQQRLALMPSIKWKQGVAATIVASSGGYPGYYEKGKVITGIRESEALGVTVFHAGTRLVDEQMVTDGGRVLNVTATGETLHQALGSAYAGIKCIEFEGIYYRRDIGYQAL